MSTYTPDKWVLINIKVGEESIQKVLGGWYGGYLNGDSWRLNSGVKETIDHGEYFEFKGYSGSSYICYKHSQGMSSYMNQIYEAMSSKKSNTTEMEIVTL